MTQKEKKGLAEWYKKHYPKDCSKCNLFKNFDIPACFGNYPKDCRFER